MQSHPHQQDQLYPDWTGCFLSMASQMSWSLTMVHLQHSQEFGEYSGFTHRKVTPLWPRAIGEVERFMQIEKRVVKTANMERKNWKQEMYKFLHIYQATLHITTGPPASALFSRSMRIKLPHITTSEVCPEKEQQDWHKQHQMKVYANSKAFVTPSTLEVEDSVVVQRNPSSLKHHLKR